MPATVSSPATAIDVRSYAELHAGVAAGRRLAARGGAAARRSRRPRAARRRTIPDRPVRRVDRRSHPGVDLSAVDDERSAALLRADRRHPARRRRARGGDQPRARCRRSRTARALCPDLAPTSCCAETLDAPGARRRTRGRRSTTSRSCSSRRDRPRRPRASRSRTRTCRRTSTRSSGPRRSRPPPTDVGVSWLPLNHDMGLVGMALGALYTRRTVRAAAAARRSSSGRSNGCGRSRATAAPSASRRTSPTTSASAASRRDLDGLDLSSLARRRLRRRADSPADARRVRREVRAGRVSRHQLPARATASPSTCSRRRSRRAAGVRGSSACRPTT